MQKVWIKPPDGWEPEIMFKAWCNGFDAYIVPDIKMVTKRGTNDWHGAGYWYHQNDTRYEAVKLDIIRP